MDRQAYYYYTRDLLETIKLLLDRVGADVELPSFRRKGSRISTFWHASDYQDLLRKFVAAGYSLDLDLLLPLLFFSGKPFAVMVFS